MTVNQFAGTFPKENETLFEDYGIQQDNLENWLSLLDFDDLYPKRQSFMLLTKDGVLHYEEIGLTEDDIDSYKYTTEYNTDFDDVVWLWYYSDFEKAMKELDIDYERWEDTTLDEIAKKLSSKKDDWELN